MSNIVKRAYRPRTPSLSVSLFALVAALPLITTYAKAQEAAPEAAVEAAQEERPTLSKKRATAPSSTINLVNLLVKQGVIDDEQASALIKQAEEEAYVSREAARDATEKAGEAAKAATAAAAAASPPGSKRVSYVPDIVKRELREDIRKEVMGQAKAEGWASPGAYPEWASRIRFSGDIRGRWEGMFYPGGVWSAEGGLTDFNAINTGSPYDESENLQISAPSYNADDNRYRSRLRARLGMDADLGEGFTAGMRIATGSDSSPVSTNQTLGGSGGNFSKYSLWLDRAFIKFEPFQHEQFSSYAPDSALAINVGRFDNPYWAPTDLVWDGDLGFDGIALQGSHNVRSDITAFGSAGLFPLFNTSLNFATTNENKFESEDKYLLGGQIGFNWQATPLIGFAFGAGVYEFNNVRGELSSPCDTWSPNIKDCDTDHMRPSFAQKGNTYMRLRQRTTSPSIGEPGYIPPEPNYYGLASEFRPVVLSTRLDFQHFDPIRIGLEGDFVWNSAFDRSDILYSLPVNNYDGYNNYDGGEFGWMTRVTVGNTKLKEFGDWNASIAYKWLESDAVLDALADSDFGLGGTNLKGYIIGGNVALSDNVSAAAKWMSASEITGIPYAVDILQLDVTAKF
jgi:hypothetical protein